MLKICLVTVVLCSLAGAVIGFFMPFHTPKMIRVVYPLRYIEQGTIITADMPQYGLISEEGADCAYTDIKGLVGGTARYNMSPDTNVSHCPVYDKTDVLVSDEFRYVYTRR